MASSVLPIEPKFLNISLYLIRDQIPYRLSLFNQLADLRGGDIEKRNFFEIKPMAREVNPSFFLGVVSKMWDQSIWE